jgi:DNA-binding FadR family transcriptional regulator
MSEPTPVFAPVRLRRAFEAVCDQIRQQVADGRLAAGDRLPSERELSEQFGVSRSGVREALRSLEMAGMVEALTGINGGFYIKQAHPDGITQAVRDMVSLNKVPVADLTEARILLCGLAIRLACERGTEADFQAIEADTDRFAELVKQGKPVRDSGLVTEFYRLIARATHNEVIVMLVDALSEVLRVLLARLDSPPQGNVVQVRRKVLRLMRERDPEKASAALAKHLNALNVLLEAMEARKPAR